MKLNKRGQFNALAGMGIGIAILAISLTVCFLILSQGRTQSATTEGLDYTNATQCASSQICNATGTLTTAVATIPGWVPLVVIAVVGVVLLSLVSMFRSRA
ncbi:MAG: hypothetical protein KJ574_03460 [Nanoarchaeota archaeon]|nr:hypothetical protein [Nanoarchaeota archaeon]